MKKPPGAEAGGGADNEEVSAPPGRGWDRSVAPDQDCPHASPHAASAGVYRLLSQHSPLGVVVVPRFQEEARAGRSQVKLSGKAATLTRAERFLRLFGACSLEGALWPGCSGRLSVAQTCSCQSCRPRGDSEERRRGLGVVRPSPPPSPDFAVVRGPTPATTPGLGYVVYSDERCLLRCVVESGAVVWWGFGPPLATLSSCSRGSLLLSES